MRRGARRIKAHRLYEFEPRLVEDRAAGDEVTHQPHLTGLQRHAHGFEHAPMCCHHGNALLHHRLLYQHLSRHLVVPLLHKHPCIAQIHVHRAAQPLCLRVELRLPKLDLVADVPLPVLRHPFVHGPEARAPTSAPGRPHHGGERARLRHAMAHKCRFACVRSVNAARAFQRAVVVFNSRYLIP